ncbi:MAG: hypothetical protein ACOY5Y_13850 [Pseudomonadota bacterium]
MGERRNAELSRAAILAAAGGALVAMSQRVAEFGGTVGVALTVVVVIAGLVLAIWTLTRRSGGADQ